MLLAGLVLHMPRGKRNKMTDWICGQVFDGTEIRALSLGVDDGLVTSVKEAPRGRSIKGVVTPGYLDLQVNGGGGVLVNTQPDRIDDILAAHRQFGTVGLMPTVITDAPDALIAATDAALVHRDRILGLHIEGPHIALSKRGTHAREHIRPLDDVTRECISRLRAADVPVMITLAPEVVSPDDIAQFVAMGVIVSLGHSNATAEEADAGFDAGAQCVTHLFNAMSGLGHREPGLAGVALDRSPFIGLIADGIHVDDRMVGLVMRGAKGKVVLVSDAMPTVGGPKSFDLYGMDIHVENGRLVNTDGALAGAHTTMAEGVARLVRIGIEPALALATAVTHPAALIGRSERAQLIGQNIEDLLVLGDDWMPVGTVATLL